MTLIMPGHPEWGSFKQDIKEGKVHELTGGELKESVDYRKNAKEILSDEKNMVSFYENMGAVDETEKDFCNQLLQNIANNALA